MTAAAEARLAGSQIYGAVAFSGWRDMIDT